MDADPFLSTLLLRQLLVENGLAPNPRLGQNFLVDRATLESIPRWAELTDQDRVIEIGPGAGNLTGFLVQKAKQVLAIEFDRGLFALSEARFDKVANLTLRQGDALEFPLDQQLALLGAKAFDYKVIANIPYQITSPLLGMYLESATPPAALLLMVQLEVAERIVARPSEMNLLAVLVQSRCHAELVTTVPAACFWPRPKVDSALIRITPEPSRYTEPGQLTRIQVLAKAAFSQKRKQMATPLAQFLERDKQDVRAAIEKIGLPPPIRAEAVPIEAWIKLAEIFPE